MSLVKSSLENQPYYNLESIFRGFKRKEMKALRRLAENDIITRGITVKIQQVGIMKILLTMPRVKMSRADRNPWLAKMTICLKSFNLFT
jgi:hypothetical protein